MLVCGWAAEVTAHTHVLESSDVEVRMRSNPFVSEVVEEAHGFVRGRRAAAFAGAESAFE